MSVSLENNVVAILGAGGGIVGTGFVVGERLILTCAHVIEKAGSEPGGEITARFYKHQLNLRARVLAEYWSPKDDDDVAVLEVLEALPLEVTPLPLAEAAGSIDHTFSAFGLAPISDARWLRATGDIKALLTSEGHQRLQLTSQEPDHGMSGAPVLDETRQKVVGMIRSGIDSKYLVKNRDTVFAVPTETLFRICPALAQTGLWPLGGAYATAPNFTGRLMERTQLSDWLTHGPTVLIVEAHGGFGKSALAWHWLTHDIDRARWPRAVWWNFYDTREFESFLQDTLTHLGVETRDIGPRLQVDKLVEQLARPGTLLILDGFERALRAYSGMNAAYQGDEPQPPPQPRSRAVHIERGQGMESDSPLPNAVLSRSGEGPGVGAERDSLSPLADQFLRAIASRNLNGRVLITTRQCPRALETPTGLLINCREIELKSLNPADAVTLFHTLGIKGMHSEIEAVCAPYGYHPLSLGLLAGLILTDLHQPGDIAVAQSLDVSGGLIQRQHHVLEQAYNALTPTRQQLLSRLACFRNPMAYEAIRAITNDLTRDQKELDSHLHDLIARRLLQHDHTTNRYDLHPIVRRYAYDRLTDKTAAHTRLRAYFVVIEVPEKFKTLDELTPLIELYHHTVRAGQYDEAYTLFRDRINKATHFQFGAYQLRIEFLRALFPDGENRPPRLKDEADHEGPLGELANSYSLSGQPRRAGSLYEHANTLNEKRGDKRNFAIGLGNVATMAQLHIGELKQAEANLRRSVELCREIKDKFLEAVECNNLGRVLTFRGAWDEAAEELTRALKLFKKQDEVQSQGVVWADRALRALLMGNQSEALTAARRALELADEDARTTYPSERDYVHAHWLLGAAHRVNSNLAETERHLIESLTRCRGINLVESEADILIDLARLRVAQGEPEEAERLAREALEITERCGYVLQGADAHLVLAKLALSSGDKAQAHDHAQAARQLATCDGEPYVYRVAYDEAGALLKQLEGT